jgi:hypothetical protein
LHWPPPPPTPSHPKTPPKNIRQKLALTVMGKKMLY